MCGGHYWPARALAPAVLEGPLANSPTFPVLLDGYTDLPPGRIANLVTFLERRDKPANPPVEREGLAVRHVADPDIDWFRGIYRRVGEPWLWFSALVMPADALAARLRSPATAILAIEANGADIGLAEIEFTEPGDAEIVSFGLIPEAFRTGASRPLMDHTLAHAFRPGVERVWLHTCSFDHPSALAFYRKSGFSVWKLAIEVCEDPRRAGALPLTAAPHVPLAPE